MRKRIIDGSLIISILGLFFVMCTKEVVTPREYPRIKTLKVSDITEAGATLNAEIIFVGNQEIEEYGFVWSSDRKDPIISKSEKIVFKGSVSEGFFSSLVKSTLIENELYYVRPYAITQEYTVYGKSVSFISLGSKAPNISSFEPLTGTLGDTILISGSNFSYILNNNIVTFGIHNSRLIHSTDSSILAIVPDTLNVTNLSISVKIAGNSTTLEKPKFSLLKPKISNVLPNYGRSGDRVVITGMNFGNLPAHALVKFNNKKVNLLYHDRGEIQVIVPNDLTVKSKIYLVVGPNYTVADFNYLSPSILDFNPKTATWGDTISVLVKNFPILTDSVNLKLNNNIYKILSTSESLVKFLLPLEISTRGLSVGFNVAGVDLNFEDSLSLLEPEILTFRNDTIDFGENIKIQVNNFHPKNNSVSVDYRSDYGVSTENPQLNTLNSKNVEFTFPTLGSLRDIEPEDNVITVNISVANVFTLSKSLVVRAPEIYSFSPLVITAVSSEVVISGKNFDSESSLEYNSTELEILNWSENSLTAVFPISFIKNYKISKYETQPLVVRGKNLRSSSSKTPLVFDYKTAWENVNESGIFYVGGKPRFDYSVWSNSSFGYLIGGYTESKTFPLRVRLYDFWRYDPNLNSWDRLQDIPIEEVSQISHIFHVQDYAYVMGYGGKNMLRYDYLSENWQTLGQIPSSFYGIVSSFYINGVQFVVSHNDSKVFRYDIANDDWVFVADTPLYGRGIRNHYSYNGNEIFNISNTGYEFDPNTYMWSTQVAYATGKFIEHESNYYTYGSDDFIYSYFPSSMINTLITEMPNGSGIYINHLFSIDGYLYFRDNSIVRFNTAF